MLISSPQHVATPRPPVPVRRDASRWLLTAIIVATSLPAQGPGSVEIGAYGQVTRVEPSQARFATQTPLSLGVRGRVNLHRGIGIELEASTSEVEGTGDPPQRRYNQIVARATWTKPLSEYSGLLLGAGLARTDYEVTYNFGPSALLGVRTVIRDRYVLRSDAIFNYLPTSGAREFAVRTGVQVVYGPADGQTSRDQRSGNRTVQLPGTLEGGLFLQQWRLDPVWNLRDGRALGTRVGAFLTSRSQVEVEATYWRREVRVGGQVGQTGFPLGSGETYRVTSFAFRYVHNVPVGARLGLVAAAGPVRSSVEYADHWGLSAVVGARLALTRDLQLRADATGNYLPNVRATDLGLRLGVSTLLRLGKE
jgi:hypothetical protein